MVFIPILSWSAAYILGLTLALLPVFMAIVFLHLFGVAFFSMLKKHPLPAWQLIDEDEQPNKSDQALRESARRLGLLPLGLFQDGPKTRYRPFISEDGQIVMLIEVKPILSDFVFYSRTQDGVWLATYLLNKDHDLSPYFQSEMAPTLKPEGVFFYHEERFQEQDERLSPFAPESFAEDYSAQKRASAQFLVDHGYATWLDPEQTQWKGTLRGAIYKAKASTDKKRFKMDRDRIKRCMNVQNKFLKGHKKRG